MRPSFIALILRALPLLPLLCACGGSDPAPSGGGDAGDTATDAGMEESEFSTIHATILEPRCAIGGCHGGDTPVGGLDMRTADSAHASLVGQSSDPDLSCGGMTRVVAGDPDASLLWLKLNEPPCGSRMPLLGEPLEADQLELIRAWIAAGAER